MALMGANPKKLGSGALEAECVRRRELVRTDLHAMTVVLLVSAGIIWPSLGTLWQKTWPNFAGGALIVAIAYALLFLKGERSASLAISVPFVPVIFVGLWTNGGLSSGGGSFLLTALLFAGATLGRTAAIFVCVESVVGLAFISWSEALGHLPTPLPEHVIVLSWTQNTVALLLSAYILDRIVHMKEAASKEAELVSHEKFEAESRFLSARTLEPVGQLASGVAHDFNNLLSVMTSVSSSLRTEGEDKDSLQELLDDLDEATERARVMTGQLLSFSQGGVFEVDAVNLDEMLESITPMLSRLLGDEILVETQGSTEGLSVEADQGQLEQIVLNLAVNARDAMPHGGTVSISTGCIVDQETVAYIEVADSGIGMSEETIENIFTPFFTTKPKGTGLGLATVHNIVQRLGGKVEVRSQLNEGTCIRLEFPASRLSASPRRVSVSRQPVLQPRARVLLVEDHDLLRRATQRTLEQVGYTVISVNNGQEALTLIREGACFDVLVSDLSMPLMGGVELTLLLDQQGLRPPTVLVSGNATHLPKELEHILPSPRFLPKPFAQDDFLKCVRKSISEGKKQKDSQSSPLSRVNQKQKEIA